jgi:hypothetical protein
MLYFEIRDEIEKMLHSHVGQVLTQELRDTIKQELLVIKNKYIHRTTNDGFHNMVELILKEGN